MNSPYPVVLLSGLHPHVVGLVPSVLDGLRSVSPPQGVRGKLARGQVGGALLLHLWCHRRKNKSDDHFLSAQTFTFVLLSSDTAESQNDLY